MQTKHEILLLPEVAAKLRLSVTSSNSSTKDIVDETSISDDAFPLFIAIENGKPDEVCILLKNNRKWVDARNKIGLTPLHYAVELESIRIVQRLLDRGASISAKNNEGCTPLDIAKVRNNTAIIEYIEGAALSRAIMNGLEKNFIVGSHRVRIICEEGAEHPWRSENMKCYLVCWGQDKDIWFDCDDIELDNRPVDMKAIENPEDLKKWKEAQEGKLYYILYIEADKYGFMIETDVPDSGALVLTEKIFREHNPDFNGTIGDLMEQMEQVAKQEFRVLQAWYSGNTYGWIIEEDTMEHKPFQSSIKHVDSGWGYYCTGIKEMYEAMIAQFSDNSDIRKQLAKQMLEYITGLKDKR